MVTSQISAIVHPWYGQFYLRRGNADWASDRVSRSGYEARLEAIGGFVYVGVATYGHPTRVVLEVHDNEPELADADHQVELSLTGEGSLAVLSWGAEDPDAVIEVPEGNCRMRTSWFGLAAAEALLDNDLGSEDLSPEQVHFTIWPAAARDRRVLREWHGE